MEERGGGQIISASRQSGNAAFLKNTLSRSSLVRRQTRSAQLPPRARRSFGPLHRRCGWRDYLAVSYSIRIAISAFRMREIKFHAASWRGSYVQRNSEMLVASRQRSLTSVCCYRDWKLIALENARKENPQMQLTVNDQKCYVRHASCSPVPPRKENDIGTQKSTP